MNKQQSIEFELEGLDEEIQEQPKLYNENYDDYQFRDADYHDDKSQTGQIIMRLQATLKKEYLILNNQEKRKNQSVKTLEFAYRKAILKYIQYRGLLEDEVAGKLLLNEKDIQDIQPNLYTDLKKFSNELSNTPNLIKLFSSNMQQPPIAFIQDFNNFFPNYLQHLDSLLRLEVDNANKPQNVFQSEYTFPARILKNLYRRYDLEIFSQRLLQKGIRKMCALKSQLIIGFEQQYQRIKDTIYDTKALKSYILGGYSVDQHDLLIKELQKIIGLDDDEDIISSIVQAVAMTEMDPNNYNLMMNEFKTYLQCDAQHINFKLGMLTYKSIGIKRRIIQEIVSIFINDIIEAIDAYPVEIRYVVKTFEFLTISKFGQSGDSKAFFIKTVFSKWLSTDLMRYYIGRSTKSISFQEKNTNFSIVCLVLQKILLGQPFHDKQTNMCFNTIIQHYKTSIDAFITKFKDIDLQKIKKSRVKALKLEVNLLSFESIRYILSQFRQNPHEFPQFQQFVQLEGHLSRSFYQIGNQKYSPPQLYVLFTEVKTTNFTKIFTPNDKIKKILIQFLVSIEDLHEAIPLYTLLQRNRYGTDMGKIFKVPVQLYANYLLSLANPDVKIEPIVDAILEELQATKKEQKRTRVFLEQQKNYCENLEKQFLSMCGKKMQIKAQFTVQSLWDTVKIRFRMVHRPKEFLMCQTTKESDYKRNDKTICFYEAETIREFLKQLAAIYKSEKIFEFQNSPIMINQVYNAYVEELIDLLTNQQKIEELVVQKLKERMGIYLFNTLRLKTFVSPRDKALNTKIQQVSKVGLQQLEPKYAEEQQLFYQSVKPNLQSLNEAASAEGLLKKFHEISLTLQHIIVATGKAADITADVQIPLMQFVLLRSGVINLQSLFSFMEKFCMQETLGSIYGQILSLVKSILLLIEQM